MKFLAADRIVAIVPSPKVRRSVGFLTSKHDVLQEYQSLEDFVDALISDAPGRSELSGIEFHLACVRNNILQILRGKGVYVGQSVVEELTFYIFRDGKHTDPFRAILEWIRDSGLHRPGLLIFPLYGIGILRFGAFRSLGRADATMEFVLRRAGIVFSPQTNSDKATAALIQRATKYLGIRQTVPIDSIEHHLRFSVMGWLTRNPLLFVKLRAVSGERFENQRFVTMKLRLTTSFLMFIHTLEASFRGPKAPAWSSSRFVNNWATLDIKHYLFYQTGGKNRPLQGIRVPLAVDGIELTELSGLGIDLSPEAWKTRRKIVSRVKKAFDGLEGIYLNNVFVINKDTALGRTARKVYQSLKYFRRSFRPSSEPDERYVNLAIAFETLLVDGGNAGARKTITTRLRAALRGVPRSDSLVRSVRRAYLARNEIVHSGSASTGVDLRLAQKAFAECFMHLCMKLHKLRSIPRNCPSPIKELLGV